MNTEKANEIRLKKSISMSRLMAMVIIIPLFGSGYSYETKEPVFAKKGTVFTPKREQ